MTGRGASVEVLWRTARTLSRRTPLEKARNALPPLFFVTDPERTPDPVRAAQRLPRGCGVIYRTTGGPEAAEAARELAETARRRGLVLLVSTDEALAAAVGADGLHLPERMLNRAPGVRLRHPRWRITGAAHSRPALEAAYRAGVDAALLSAVFPSRSASASGRRPLGPTRFAALVRQARLPVYALGGVRTATGKGLLESGAAGLAAVDGLYEA